MRQMTRAAGWRSRGLQGTGRKSSDSKIISQQCCAPSTIAWADYASLKCVKCARILVVFWFASAVLGVGQRQKNAAKPDIFLVTIDTLRADHVHCYGYESIQTPALDGLAKDGIRFTHAFTPSPITNTSHTSILT